MDKSKRGPVSMEAVLFDQESPVARGLAHGELWRQEIAELAEIRTTLALKRGAFVDRAQLYAVAKLHLVELETVAPQMYEELVGISTAANLSAEQLMVLNHYTDLRDVSPAVLDEVSPPDESRQAATDTGPSSDPGGCTALHVYGPEGMILGQTWDMHGTAAEFVRMLRIAPKGSDKEVLSFSLTGCLGMTGINESGVAVTINNLTSTDAQVGLCWPALVRRLLEQSTAQEARDLLMATRLSSGHHYMIADARNFFGIETSGKQKVQTQEGAKIAHLHTNHCFDPRLRKHEKVAKISTSFRRMDLATAAYAESRPSRAQEVWDFLSSHEGYPKSICSHVDNVEGDPSASKTCGQVVMKVESGEVLAVRGCAHEHERVSLKVSRWQPPPAV